VIKKPEKRRPRPDLGCSAIGRKERSTGRSERMVINVLGPVSLLQVE
jgi:hypothetical protein